MEERKLMRDVFGSSSESEDNDDEDDRHGEKAFLDATPAATTPEYENPQWTWEHVRGIDGLWICRDFLSAHQRSSLLSTIEDERWFSDASRNQAMRFGDLPKWALELSSSIRDAIFMGSVEGGMDDLEMRSDTEETCVMPSRLLWREPFFDQLIMNVYQPGEGICAHVDLMRFDDGIAIVSLESPCVMHFSRAEEASSSNGSSQAGSNCKIPVFLAPGSLVIMWGDARYQWKHEINRKQGFQVWQGQEIDQRKRTSITLRKLCTVPD